MSHWIIVLTGFVRWSFWTIGFFVAVMGTGRLGQVRWRREVLATCFGVTALNAMFFTYAAATGGPVWLLPVISSLGVIVAALFVAAILLTAYGPSKSADGE